MNKNTPILNPYTGQPTFGVIPSIKSGRDYFDEGDILLKYGRHFGPNRGFGVNHIWLEHRKELVNLGYETKNDVARFVADIITKNAALYCEFNDLRGSHRIAVVKSSCGIAYLEKKYTGDNTVFYSVITAFDKKKAHGTRIGSVK